MCGIAGIWNLNDENLHIDDVKCFTDTMIHRGPDGAGYELFNENTIGLGHRRLSILDITDAGKQPFQYLDRYAITYNGEVYNFLEIRNELQAKGYTFKTDTDTEVILVAYHVYGKDCLTKFNGMWAFAIWDKQDKRLFISRDRYGVKPLHYVYLPGKLFAFASETIAFKKLKNFTRRFNETNLITAIQNSSHIEASGKTIFKDIYQLLPGHTINISFNKELIIERWWNTAGNLVEVDSDYEKQVEKFKELFFSACKLRMRSDVPIASALSGGLDSSSVYCTLQQFKNETSNLERIPSNWQKAFIATFPGTSMDERMYAEEVINHTKGNAVYITPDYINLLKDITTSTQLFDGIIANPLIAISDIYKSMRSNGIVVSLDGHGADEYAFGYSDYSLQMFYEALQTNNEAKAIEAVKILNGLSPNYSFQKLMNEFYNANSIKAKIKNKIKAFIGTKNQINNSISRKSDWFKKDAEIVALNSFTNPFTGITKMLFNDFHYNSLPINLRDFDRASMQNSIEIRMPFMDYRLVNFMFSIPEESKLGHGYTKRIIRDAMKGIVPEKIRTRTLKIGIGSPIAEWIADPMKEFTLDHLNSNKIRELGFLNSQNILKSVKENYTNNSWNSSNASKTWSILNALIINE
ncbi:MAG: asparagine synthase (glutamine-hydrolyzing) [Bacteroidota bacterium]|nr:asparagine synthase (glutamine-hydrolyzing) [Bacteroidota bacterium]